MRSAKDSPQGRNPRIPFVTPPCLAIGFRIDEHRSKLENIERRAPQTNSFLSVDARPFGSQTDQDDQDQDQRRRRDKH
jgi:hypothetical protein